MKGWPDMTAAKSAAAGFDSLALALILPPRSERPICVPVAWLAEHPGHAARLEYLDHNEDPPEWAPASAAVHMIDPGWPVKVRVKP